MSLGLIDLSLAGGAFQTCDWSIVQVSFAPLRGGKHSGRLIVTALPASSLSTQRSHSAFRRCVTLTATADHPVIQVIIIELKNNDISSQGFKSQQLFERAYS